MWLALDIGNSTLKGAFFGSGGMAGRWQLPLSAEGDAAAWRERLSGIIGGRCLSRAGVASVVPWMTEHVAQALGPKVPLLEVGASLRLPFAVGYQTPHTLGSDRLASAAAAWDAWGGSGAVVVVDMGTATNIEAISAKGVYLGGAIAAGPELLRRALAADTAQLPRALLAVPQSAIGRSTQEALQAGIMLGVLDQVSGALRRIRLQLGEPCTVVATGGWTHVLGGGLPMVDHVDEHLTLKGIRLLMEMNAADPP